MMEVDSHPSPSSSTSPRLRGPPGLSLATFLHHPRMAKRERSPEGTDAGADRPSKRAAILATMCPAGNSSQQHSEDWVQQAGGLRIGSPAGGNGVTQGIGVVGLGRSTSAQMDVDVAMAVEDDTAGVLPLQEEERQESPSFAQQQTLHSHPAQLILPQRSHSLPNPSLSSCHPYGQHSVQQQVRNADGSPLINVVLATPAASQQSLSMTEAPTSYGTEYPRPPSAQSHMLQTNSVTTRIPPLSGSTAMSLSTPPLVQQDLSPLTHPSGKNKRVAFGPRLNCDKCRQGEIHFAHFHYE